ELLRGLDLPVLVSEHDTASKLPDDATLVVLEPLVVEQGTRSGALADMIAASSRALVVLPKWYGEDDPTNPSRLVRVALVPDEEIEPILRALGIGDGRLVRRPRGGPVPLEGDALGLDPLPPADLVGPQLIQSELIEPVLWTG